MSASLSFSIPDSSFFPECSRMSSEFFNFSHEPQPPRDFEIQSCGGESPSISLGRLQQCLSGWYAFGASTTVLNWIAHGASIPWRSFPPAPRAMKNSVSVVKYRKFVNEAVAQVLSAGAIPQIRQRPMVVSPLGVIAKINSDKLKLIVNMRYGNKKALVTKHSKVQNGDTFLVRRHF